MVATSIFFKLGRGIRKGFPLAPLLFILIMEDLIRMISRDKINDTLKNFHFGKFVYITYLLFVDDILLFSDGSRRKIIKLKSIIELF